MGVTNFVVFLEAYHIVMTFSALMLKLLEVGQQFQSLLLLLIQEVFQMAGSDSNANCRHKKRIKYPEINQRVH